MAKQLNLFASVPVPFRVDILYVPCTDRAFFQNERPTTIKSEVIETSPYELDEHLREIAQSVATDPKLPRAGRTSRYLIRAFDQEGKLYATA